MADSDGDDSWMNTLRLKVMSPSVTAHGPINSPWPIRSLSEGFGVDLGFATQIVEEVEVHTREG